MRPGRRYETVIQKLLHFFIQSIKIISRRFSIEKQSYRQVFLVINLQNFNVTLVFCISENGDILFIKDVFHISPHIIYRLKYTKMIRYIGSKIKFIGSYNWGASDLSAQ